MRTLIDPKAATRQLRREQESDGICISLGFRRVAARRGFWYHPEIGESRTFCLTDSDAPIETHDDIIARIFESGRWLGADEARTAMRRAMGLV